MFALGFCVPLSLVEHRFVEVALRYSTIIFQRVATHDIVANDPTESFVLKSWFQRIQYEPPSFLQLSVDLLNQCYFSH